MSIKRIIADKTDIEIDLVDLFTTFFNIESIFAQELYDTQLRSHIDQLRDDVSFFVEAPYIDKVYRDSFYSYFSSKLGNYKKDCIRISIFNGPLTEELFSEVTKFKELSDNYLGFMVVRPTIANIVGRSVISPKAVKHNGFLAITAKIGSTANFLKLEVEGFPHSSQDTETMTCAETSIWAIMEYFGYKYPEYKPVLPSKIIEVLKKVSAERQVPSRGLNIQQMAFALKEFGFATRIYGKSQFQNEFKKIFSTYIESGLPIIIAVDNRDKGGNIGHAFLTIGHERTDSNSIDFLNVSIETDDFINNEITRKGILLYDHDDIDRNYVFVDDNMPAYCLNNFDTPTSHYYDKSWHDCEITFFIVPLHTKIYLEAYEAKNFCKQILFGLFVIPNNTELYFRFFLSSSRSYKHYVAQESGIKGVIKDIILETEMPKFIWIAEISNKSLIKQNLANGFIIIDATEANIFKIKPLIAGWYDNDLLSIDNSNGSLSRIPIPSQNFSIFTNNLKGF